MVLVAGVRPVFQSRGLRNNNPGNIRENERVDYDWIGEAVIDNDDEFEVFVSPEYGIRAIGRIWDSYARRGVRSVEGIISTWAPRNENDTASYIRAVERRTGWHRTDIVTRDDFATLADAVIHHENGQQPFSRDFIEYGLQLA